MNYIFRKTKISDLNHIISLYKKSTKVKEGIARTSEEITVDYVQDSLSKSINHGLGIVIESENGDLIGVLLSYKFEPKSFCHTLGNMTMAIDPDCLGQSLGKRIFEYFLSEIKQNHPDIFRVELNVRRTNKIAIKIYESVGFELEGIMKNRILDSDGNLSDDSFMAWMNPNFKGEK